MVPNVTLSLAANDGTTIKTKGEVLVRPGNVSVTPGGILVSTDQVTSVQMEKGKYYYKFRVIFASGHSKFSVDVKVEGSSVVVEPNDFDASSAGYRRARFTVE